MKRTKIALVIAGVLGLAACAGILGLKKKDGPRPFEHRAHVLKGISCVKCHVGMDQVGDTGPLHLPDTASCIGCHDKPHQPDVPRLSRLAVHHPGPDPGAQAPEVLAQAAHGARQGQLRTLPHGRRAEGHAAVAHHGHVLRMP